MRRRVLSIVPLLVAGLAVTSQTAHADATKDVGLTGFRDMVVDSAHGHVFISQGTSKVVVTNLAGKRLGAISGLAGADGMALSDDDSHLFVALSGADAVAKVNAAHPLAAGAVTTYSTGANTCPLDLAYTAGLVWYAATCDGQWAQIKALDPDTGTTLDTAYETVYNPRLAASPAVPNTFFAGDQGESPESIYKYTVTGGATPTISGASDWDVHQASSLAINGEGTQVVTGGRQVFHTTDLTHAGAYPGGASENAVAVRASDDMVAFGTSHGVTFFKNGAAKPYADYRFGVPTGSVVTNGLAFGKTELYAVAYSSQSKPHYQLRVLTPRRPAKIAVSVAGSHFRYGQRATVTATLRSATKSRKISIYAQPAGGQAKLVETRAVNHHGQLRVRVPVTRATVLSAVFAGDDRFGGASASKRVRVAARVTVKPVRATGHAGRYALFPASKKAYVLSRVFPNHAGECLYFRAQFHVRGRWGHDTTTDCGLLSSGSAAGAFMKGAARLVGIPIRIRAEWTGDSLNTKTDSRWQYVKFVHGSHKTVSPRAGAFRGESAAIGSVRIPR